MDSQPETNLFEDLDALNLTKRQRGQIIPRLIPVLEQSPSPVARALFGQKTRNQETRKWSQKSMRDLEKEIFRKGTYRPLACDMLKVLRKVCAVWVMRHETASIPRLGVLIRPFDNPMNQNLPRCLKRYRAWGEWLGTSLKQDAAQNATRKTPAPILSIEPLLVSSILYGGLFDRASVLTLVRELPNLSAHTLASKDAVYVGLRVPWGGFGQTEFRCWQPDPVTAAILARTSPSAAFEILNGSHDPSGSQLDTSALLKRIAKRIHAIRKVEVEHNESAELCGLEALIKSVQTVAYVQMPAIIAAYGSRKFRSDSLPFDAMIRIAAEDWIVRPRADGAPASEHFSSNGVKGSSGAANGLTWTDQFQDAIREEMKWEQISSNLRKLAQSNSIPPLARRLADFAERVFSIRTLFDKPRSARTMRARVMVLARAFSSIHGDGDFASLPTESLEDLYRKSIHDFRDQGKSPREINLLIRAIRELHSYLCALHGKRPLSDDKLLAPLPVLDRTDANILTIEEYKKLLSMIELEWPTEEHFERRKIARLLVILGYRAGLRREESRLLRTNDLVLEGREILWIRPSPGHTLKSDYSLRRLNLWKLLTKEELDDLRRWVMERKLSGNDFLFKTETLDVVPQSIFDTINDMIARITGTASPGAHFHHCRHTLSSLLFTRLIIGKGGRVHEFSEDRHRTLHRLAANDLEMDRLYANSFPKRTLAFFLARLQGHCHPAVSVRYIHTFGILLDYFMQRAPLMQPDQALVEVANGRYDKGSPGNLERQEVTLAAIEILCRRDDFDLMDRTDHKLEAGRHCALNRENWITESRRFLRHFAASGDPLDMVAAKFNFEVGAAREMLDRLRKVITLETKNGTLRHRIREFEPESPAPIELGRRALPRLPVNKTSLEMMNWFAPRVYDLTLDPQGLSVLQRGIDAYVQRVWSSRSSPVFRYEQCDGQDAHAFLGLWTSLELKLNRIRFVCFDPSDRSRWPNIWRCALGFSEQIDIEKRKKLFFDREDTRSWLEMAPTLPGFETNGPDAAGRFGFRYVLTMAYIAFGSDKAIAP